MGGRATRTGDLPRGDLLGVLGGRGADADLPRDLDGLRFVLRLTCRSGYELETV